MTYRPPARPLVPFLRLWIQMQPPGLAPGEEAIPFQAGSTLGCLWSRWVSRHRPSAHVLFRGLMLSLSYDSLFYLSRGSLPVILESRSIP